MKVYLLSVIVLLFILPLISAQGVNPVQVNLQPNTCEIIYPKINEIKINDYFVFHVHVQNASGMVMKNTTTSCLIHVYNITGKHTVETNMSWDSNNVDFYYTLPPMKKGMYTILVNCNDSKIGCFLSEEFKVSKTGQTQTDAQGINTGFLLLASFLITLLLIYLGSNFIKSEILWVLGVLLLGLSFFSIIYNLYLVWHIASTYIGLDYSGGLEEVIFKTYLYIISGSLIITFVLLLWNRRGLIDKIRKNLNSEDEDGWDNNNYDKK